MNNFVIWTIFYSSLSFLIINLVILVFKNINKEYFSLRKIIILSSFMAIFIIQNILWLPISHLPIVPWSMELVIIISVGFLFGPLDGIVFGILADIFGTLVSGYMILPLYMVGYPMVGLISGYFSRIKKLNKISKKTNMVIFQTILLLFYSITLSVMFTSLTNSIDNIMKISIIVFSSVSFILFEIISIYIYHVKESENIGLFSVILLITILSRVFQGLLITSMANSYYFGTTYYFELVSRIITSSYLIPFITLFSYLVISSSNYAMKVTNYKL